MRRSLLCVPGVALLLVASSLPPASAPAAPTSQEANVTSRLDGAERLLGQRRAREQVLTTDVSRFTRRIRVLQTRTADLARREAAAEAEVGRKQTALRSTQASLRAQRARRQRLRRRLDTVRRVLARRLVELYEADRPDVLTVVLNSNGFADLLERADFLGRIAEADRALLLTVRGAAVDAGTATRLLTRLERRQALIAAVVRSRRDAITRVRTQAQRAQASLEAARSVRQSALRRVGRSRSETEREVVALRAQQAKVRRTLQRAQATEPGLVPGTLPPGPMRGAGGGPMIWPVNGPITSPFCERRSYEACHPGLDIGVPEGTPIRAAAAGRVVLLQPVAASGGYGNYTCVQHSSSLSSCYAHQSRFGTSAGATVKQGQVIGYVGNTGHSFGPHLHWEVRVNGSIANPLNYV